MTGTGSDYSKMADSPAYTSEGVSWFATARALIPRPLLRLNACPPPPSLGRKEQTEALLSTGQGRRGLRPQSHHLCCASGGCGVPSLPSASLDLDTRANRVRVGAWVRGWYTCFPSCLFCWLLFFFPSSCKWQMFKN